MCSVTCHSSYDMAPPRARSSAQESRRKKDAIDTDARLVWAGQGKATAAKGTGAMSFLTQSRPFWGGENSRHRCSSFAHPLSHNPKRSDRARKAASFVVAASGFHARSDTAAKYAAAILESTRYRTLGGMWCRYNRHTKDRRTRQRFLGCTPRNFF